MRKIFQIIFCILTCLSVAALPFLWIYLKIQGLIGALCGILLFGALMFLAKYAFQKKKRKPDFMNSDEENEEIRRENGE